jgi:putative transposase
MVQVKDLTELTLKDLWQEIKGEDDWWGDLKEEVVKLLKGFLETTMEQDIAAQLQAGKYRRTESRCGYRNGYRYRGLLTEFGLLENLRVPRDRDGLYQPAMLLRYQRRQQEVNRLVREAFLAGVSTRRLGEVLAPIVGETLSPQTVSRIASSLDSEVRRYHSRSLQDDWLYLFLDGITLKVKGLTGARKRLVLCVYGITPRGKRELLSFRQANAESEAQWEAFLQDLYRRGLEGKTLQLVVTDGCPGLHRALDTVYPYIDRQRCWAHKLRNVAAKLPRKIQEACLKGAKTIYQAETSREARDRFLDWAAAWHAAAPRAVSCIGDDLPELLNFLKCPISHRRKVRTTNAIERSFREVRRRTRPMSCFQNTDSVERIIFGVISHMNEKWKEKPLKEFTHNT